MSLTSARLNNGGHPRGHGSRGPWGRASATAPATRKTWERAVSFCQQQGMAGIGYVFGPEDLYTGVDLDQCRDPATGIIKAWAQEIITALSSYTELSPSETGVHVIIAGKLPPEGRKKDCIEMYDSGRFFTMTGEHLEGTSLTIEHRQAELDTLH
jgi:putative DNA primase/helicase